jgi:hypothetical protein
MRVDNMIIRGCSLWVLGWALVSRPKIDFRIQRESRNPKGSRRQIPYWHESLSSEPPGFESRLWREIQATDPGHGALEVVIHFRN